MQIACGSHAKYLFLHVKSHFSDDNPNFRMRKIFPFTCDVTCGSHAKNWVTCGSHVIDFETNWVRRRILACGLHVNLFISHATCV